MDYEDNSDEDLDYCDSGDDFDGEITWTLEKNEKDVATKEENKVVLSKACSLYSSKDRRTEDMDYDDKEEDGEEFFLDLLTTFF